MPQHITPRVSNVRHTSQNAILHLAHKTAHHVPGQPTNASLPPPPQVLLLGEGGHTVYVGQPTVALLYFEKGLKFMMPPQENPADVLLDIIAGKVPREG